MKQGRWYLSPAAMRHSSGPAESGIAGGEASVAITAQFGLL